MEAVESEFYNYMRAKQIPTYAECLNKIKNNETLKNRSPTQIRSYIQYKSQGKCKGELFFNLVPIIFV